MKNRKKLLSEEDIKLIFRKYLKGEKVEGIARDISCSDMFVHAIVHYYIGRDTPIASRISAHNKEIIDNMKKSLKPILSYDSDHVYYECSILFGLIKLTFKPKKLK